MLASRTRLSFTVVFLAGLALGSVPSLADAGSFRLLWSGSGPYKVTTRFREGNSNIFTVHQTSNAESWPTVFAVNWPASETRPAPASGQIQGIYLFNEVDPAADPRQYEEVEQLFRECHEIARISAARPGQFQLEIWVYMANTAADYGFLGSGSELIRLKVQAGTDLLCSLVTPGNQ